jgi:hypothetical protein
MAIRGSDPDYSEMGLAGHLLALSRRGHDPS